MRNFPLTGSRSIPFPVVAGLVARWEGDTVSGIANGDPISLWPDASGNGNDPSNVTVAAQPEYRVSGLNGLPMVIFDGVDDRLNGLILSVTNAQVFVVVNSLAAADASVLCQTGQAIPYFGLNHYAAGNLGYWNSDGAEIAVATAGLTPAVLLTWTKIGATATIFRNGASVGSNGAQGSNTLEIYGIQGINTTAAASGEYSAIIIVDSATDARPAVEHYLDTKYFNGSLGL